MEGIVYFSVRLVCVSYLLYKVWGMKGQVRKVCDLLYGDAVSHRRKEEQGSIPDISATDGSVADVMGSTRFVYLDEDVGKTVAPYMSLPLETEFIGEEKGAEEGDVECNLSLEDMKLLKEEQEELDESSPVVETVTQVVTQSDLENMGNVLFGIGGARESEEQSFRAACTLHAIRETELYAAIEIHVENKSFLKELMERYLDEEGNPLPHKASRTRDIYGKDWHSFL